MSKEGYVAGISAFFFSLNNRNFFMKRTRERFDMEKFEIVLFRFKLTPIVFK